MPSSLWAGALEVIYSQLWKSGCEWDFCRCLQLKVWLVALLETVCISDSEAARFTIKKCIEREGKISYDGGLEGSTIMCLN